MVVDGASAIAAKAARGGPIEPFRYAATEAQIDDLKQRLAQARFVAREPGEDWKLGMPIRELERVTQYWLDRFEWRATERRLAELPQFVATIGRHKVHFVHVRGKGPKTYPLILTHGWPSSFLEFLAAVPLLTAPSGQGDAPFAFDVIIPSLPGYGFSTGPLGSYTEVGDLWVELMGLLGYHRFGAHGGDIGAGITSRMGLYHADRVEGIHVLSAPKYVKPEADPSDEESAYVEYVEWWDENEGAYAHQQRTRPLTLGSALNDSPVGLAAWILEKWHAWSDQHRNIEEVASLDFLLANVTLYWLTETITPSMEMYWHNRNQPRAPWPDRRVEVPTRLYLTNEPVDLIPESAARRIYADLEYAKAPRGGHFLAAEEPRLLAQDLRYFFERLVYRQQEPPAAISNPH